MSDTVVIGIVIVVVLALLIGGRLVLRSGKHSIEVGHKEQPRSSQVMEASGEGAVIEGARQEANRAGIDQKMAAKDGARVRDVSQDS